MNRKQRRLEKKLGRRERPAQARAGGNIDALMTEAVGYHQQGRFDQAEKIYKRVLDIDPNQPDALSLLGAIALQMADNETARDYISQAVFHRPNFPEAHSNLGTALQNLGRTEEAVASFRKALSLNPAFADGHFNLANLLKDMGRLDEALVSYREATTRKPDFLQAHSNMGNVLRDLGQLDEAIASYRSALARNPDYVEAHTNILTTEQCRSGVTAAKLFDLHTEWDAVHAEPLRGNPPEHDNPRDPEKRLRVGFVSPDLGRHPIGYYMIGLLENRIPDQVEFFCYSDRIPDDMTTRLKNASDHWLDTRELSDEDLAERIRHDGVDILIDMAGHTSGNRLLMFTRKPAPVQITWAGYVGTTGLKEIDYLLSDRYSTPDGEDACYREKIIRLPTSWLCYEPPDYMPNIGDPPANENHFTTFGNFNNPAKINDDVLAVWAEILVAVPNSRLVLKYKGIDCEGNMRRLCAPFIAQGLDQERLVFEGVSPHADLLARYNGIDIALDTFPYSGGITTLEALWMGVPVISLAGGTFAGRHSLSFLSSLGLSEYVTDDREGYVTLAKELAGDRPRLEGLRTGLRERMAGSPLCDRVGFARDFATAMRGAWREWCRS